MRVDYGEIFEGFFLIRNESGKKLTYQVREKKTDKLAFSFFQKPEYERDYIGFQDDESPKCYAGWVYHQLRFGQFFKVAPGLKKKVTDAVSKVWILSENYTHSVSQWIYRRAGEMIREHEEETRDSG